MDGNKPKQRIEKPVDDKTNLNLKTDQAPPTEIQTPEELGEEFQMPDYRPQSLFTRKQTPKWKKRKLRKIAYKSKRINRIRSKQ